jgi:hypothetical protein
MLEQPAAPGFEPTDPTLLHEQEKYDQRLVLIHERMPPLVPCALRLQKALKQRKHSNWTSSAKVGVTLAAPPEKRGGFLPEGIRL